MAFTCPTPSAQGRASTLPLHVPRGQRITSPQVLETVPGESSPFGIRLKVDKWVSRLLEESFRGCFRRQEYTPFPFLGCSAQSWPGKIRTEGSSSLSCGFMGTDYGCCPWAMLAVMDVHGPGSLRSPQSGSSPPQSSNPRRSEEREKNQTSGNELRSGHCSGV